jgi:nickel-dependent lactate racemase
LVKPLHPIDEIAARIQQADGDSVALTREAAPNGLIETLEPAAAIARALAEPLNYPPLADGIVPGDRVAIAVDGATPQLASLVRGAVEALQHAGVDPHDVSIVAADAQTCDLCRSEFTGGDSGVQFIVHDPADEKNLCMIGANKQGEKLLVNRTIFEADLVLPIGCARIGIGTAYDILYPRFSGVETLEKYRSPDQRDAIVNRKGKRSEADEAGWLIGVPMTVQVVPGHGETAARVIAGEPQAVARRCDELCRQLWSYQSPQRVSLVVATITGGPQSQTWANVGRALDAAEYVLEAGGAVVICSNLDESPGKSLGRLIGGPDLDRTVRKISRDSQADTWAAWQLARALQRGPVYFLSQLDSDTAEDLGLAPVESVDDLVRLAGRQESFAVVEDAQHAVVTVAGEGDDIGLANDA